VFITMLCRETDIKSNRVLHVGVMRVGLLTICVKPFELKMSCNRVWCPVRKFTLKSPMIMQSVRLLSRACDILSSTSWYKVSVMRAT